MEKVTEKVTVVILDTVSIQKYVFASNKLKENLGASFLVGNIYTGELGVALQEVFGQPQQVDAWKAKPEQLRLLEDSTVEYETGYIGGGNAFLMFRSREKAKEFVRIWTSRLLINTPGISTAVAIAEGINLSEVKEDMEKVMQKVSDRLIDNKNRYFPNVILPKHGITADCKSSGNSAEVWWKGNDESESRYVSLVAHSKLKAGDMARKEIEKRYAEVLQDKYGINDQISELGQTVGESHIAIVHIDGNSLGQRFKECKTLSEKRQLSLAVNEAMEKSLGKLMEYIIQNREFFEDSENGFSVHQRETRVLLSIMPIVAEGDDVTFVTDARLGLHLAEKFMGYFAEEGNNKHQKFSSCAGVAIIGTKYPFYRGYVLAEELCGNAKKHARKYEGSSWIDFYVAYGGVSGSLEEIRRKHYQCAAGTMNFGPYLIDGISGRLGVTETITGLMAGITAFANNKSWPRSKVKELRSVLPMGKDAVKKMLSEKRCKLPEIDGPQNYALEGWDNSKSPYFDMIELLEFYPKYFLERRSE